MSPQDERLLLNHAKTPGFLAPGEEFSPGPETRLDRSELLCNKVLLKYKGDSIQKCRNNVDRSIIQISIVSSFSGSKCL